MTWRRVLILILAGAAAALSGYAASRAFGAGETTGTQTFVVTYTIPTVTQTVTVGGTTTAPTTAPPPPPPLSDCTATLPAGGNAVAFFNGLAPGAVGCLHGGTYGSPSTFSDFTKSGTATARITLQSYPGETATLQGYNAIDGSNVTFTHLRVDNTNTFTGSSECGGRWQSLTLAGSSILLDHAEITATDISHSSNGVYVTGSNEEIRFNKIHDVGACLNFDHGVYIGHGTGTSVHGNWVWNIPHGWGIQLYPDSSSTHEYANVIDAAQNGLVLCSTGSHHLFEHNVVSSSFGSPGAVTSGCGPQGSSTDNVVSANDSWQNPGGIGSVGGISYSGNVTVDPAYANAAGHDYRVLNPSLAGYGLWDGS